MKKQHPLKSTAFLAAGNKINKGLKEANLKISRFPTLRDFLIGADVIEEVPEVVIHSEDNENEDGEETIVNDVISAMATNKQMGNSRI